ncbi:nuclear pore membrane glycoprotein 210-like [Salmo trutta]|uniref:nuclear pore membrane glycoprotein 210-like n=1 Tax=Salmo trutta TaxID=8032 RepID=UPI001130FE24|nr:nuclear pore membrane glycoprotein 210-like [Salmo trutta]
MKESCSLQPCWIIRHHIWYVCVCQVEVDHSALVRVRVLDSNRQPFLHRYLPLMHLKLTPSSPILTVEPAEPLDSVSVGYRVSGQTLGEVSLHLSAVDSSGSVQTSSHKQLQVYPRFTLQPRSLALTLGSVRQVYQEMQLAVGTSRSILMSPYSHYALQSNK